MPLSAVDETGAVPLVTRVRDGKAERVAVELGIRQLDTEQVEVTRGIASGDVLIVGSAKGVAAGTPGQRRAGSSVVATGRHDHFRFRHPSSRHHRGQHAGAGGVRTVLARPAPDRRVSGRRRAARRGGRALSGRVARTASSARSSIRSRKAISGISGVKKVTSNAMDGFATVLVEFVYEKDLQEATQEIRDEINAIRNELPPEMEEPVLTRVSPTDFPIVAMSVASKTMSVAAAHDPGGPRHHATAARRFRASARSTSPGAQHARDDDRRAARCAAGRQRQHGRGGRRRRGAEPCRAGRPTDRRQRRAHDSAGRPGRRRRGVRRRSSSPIAAAASIRLGDVATVHVGVEEPRTEARFNGTEAVGIDVKKAKGYSTTAGRQLRCSRPSTTSGRRCRRASTISVVRDSGTRVANSVANVGWALVEGAALTVLTVFLFLNSWRSTIITGLALPVSVIASFVAVLAFGFTLNTMSLLGLSLAIGILIDDAIVVRENIVRHVEQGRDHFTAAHEGTSEIALAVAATTFSIVVVFVPIAFMGGVAEQWMAPFALTIACSVLVSLFVSFSLDPMLSAYWPDPHLPIERRAWISRQLARFNDWFNHQADRYKSRDQLGAAASRRDGRCWRSARSSARSPCRRWDCSAASSSRCRTTPSSRCRSRRLRDRASPTRARRWRRSRRSRGAMPGVSHTYATIGGTSGSVDEGNVYVAPRAESTRARCIRKPSRERFGRSCARSAASPRRSRRAGSTTRNRFRSRFAGPRTRS